MIVTLADAKAHLGITDAADDNLITDKIAAAQAHLERRLGYRIEDRYGGNDQPGIPGDLCEAVLSLTAHYYENREGTLVGVTGQTTPLSVLEIIRAYRDWWAA